MANEIVVQEGRVGALAAATLVAGDVVVWDSNGKFAKCGNDAGYAMIVLKAAASGERVAAEQRKGMIVYAMVDGTTDVAIGDALETASSGKLVKRSTGVRVAIALAARTTDSVGLVKVMLL